MASDLPLRVTVVGEAAEEGDIPVCPERGTICPCEGVSVEDLEYTWDSGFQEMELIKRSTLAGTGVCQGMGCLPYLRSFIRQKAGELQPRFTARPVVRQLTLGEISAGATRSTCEPPSTRSTSNWAPKWSAREAGGAPGATGTPRPNTGLSAKAFRSWT